MSIDPPSTGALHQPFNLSVYETILAIFKVLDVTIGWLHYQTLLEPMQYHLLYNTTVLKRATMFTESV